MILAGLDLGKSKDFTALVVAKKHGDRYLITRIDEWKPRENDLSDVIPIINACGADALAFDGGGKPGGRPAAEFTAKMRRAAVMPVFPVVVRYLTRDADPKRQAGDNWWEIFESKAKLVEVYRRVRAEGRINCLRSVPLAWKIEEQMRFYTMRTDERTGLWQWGVFEPGMHDDIVSAMQLMLWAGEVGLNPAAPFRPANEKEAKWPVAS